VQPTLSKVDLAAARNGLYECSLADQEIAKCRACGLDVGELENRNEHLKAFFQAILAQFGNPTSQSPTPPT